MRRRPPAVALALVALLVVLAGGCRLDVEVGVAARRDGSGEVRVEVVADRELVEQVDLAAGVRADDLRRAGWEVVGPTPRPDGGQAVVATKRFTDPAGAALAVEEVGGAAGPFQGFRLRRERSFWRTTTTFDGVAELAGGPEAAFGDPALTAALGSPLGFDPAALAAAGTTLDQALGLAVAVDLPGDEVAPAPAVVGAGGARWRLGLRERTALRATSSRLNTANVVGAAVAAAAALGLAAMAAPGLLRRRRR